MKFHLNAQSKTTMTATVTKEENLLESTNSGTIYRRTDQANGPRDDSAARTIPFPEQISQKIAREVPEVRRLDAKKRLHAAVFDSISNLDLSPDVWDNDTNGNESPEEESCYPTPQQPVRKDESKELLKVERHEKVKKCRAQESIKLLSFNDAPSYLQHNPFIRTGYRGYLSTKMCIESIFWWTNETINIWSHIFGWMLFLGLTLYDLLLLNIHASIADKFIVGMLLMCFQVCMILSSLYHTFSCRSEQDFVSFLTYDLLGISLSLLAIYLSGIYYAFWCHKDWQQFYLSSVLIIFLFAMALQLPRFNISSNLKLLVFVAWAAYGVVPTLHWTIIMGGIGNPVVQLLLPRVLGMYAISSVAFVIYITKIPERFFSGRVDFIGSSHQWWHFFVVGALYYWHNTGIKYVEYRMNHGCSTNLKL